MMRRLLSFTSMAWVASCTPGTEPRSETVDGTLSAVKALMKIAKRAGAQE